MAARVPRLGARTSKGIAFSAAARDICRRPELSRLLRFGLAQ